MFGTFVTLMTWSWPGHQLRLAQPIYTKVDNLSNGRKTSIS